ncbi:Protein CBG26044 [Caenorhabditis briggsae]|uniref:Uncharacterized protein n=2 Tax=Caenorhabditis briggsae TaxID=6238 RepID=A0AAE9ISJ8_CAEBR|nr:Protein CBG26044 [Caenorhabditis briggsae]ULU02789.1 hypothetical protein L3Y34_002405 [Caenorhabditis briggsae]CAR99315.1 Protein CBG26044 [Caenorhabditis briggsae]
MRVVVMTPSAEATQARVQARTQSQAVIDAGKEDHQRKSPYRVMVSLAVIVLSNLVIPYVYPEHSDFDGTGLFLCLVSMKVAYFVIVNTEQNLIENQADLEDNSPVML